MHPVQRRRLGRANVGADVLDGVVTDREQLAVPRERRLDARDARRRPGAGGEVLEPILDPADGHAELAGGEPHEHDVHVDRGLDPVAAPRVRRSDQAELPAGQAERRRRDRVEGERALKFAHAVSDPEAGSQSATTP